MRGKTRGVNGGSGKPPEPNQPIVITDNLISGDGKPDIGSTANTADSDAGGVTQPIGPPIGFGSIESEEPVITPIDAYAGSLSAEYPGTRLRKDGKPDGRGLRSAGAKAGSNPKNLKATDLLLGIHQLLAEITGIPEFVLAETEAKDYGDATIELCNELGVPLTRKQVAIGNFCGAVTKIYATRWTAFKLRRAMEREMSPATIEVVRGADRNAQHGPPISPRQSAPMPKPANMGQGQEEQTNGQPKFSPSERWSEPAAEFPGTG